MPPFIIVSYPMKSLLLEIKHLCQNIHIKASLNYEVECIYQVIMQMTYNKNLHKFFLSSLKNLLTFLSS